MEIETCHSPAAQRGIVPLHVFASGKQTSCPMLDVEENSLHWQGGGGEGRHYPLSRRKPSQLFRKE